MNALRVLCGGQVGSAVLRGLSLMLLMGQAAVNVSQAGTVVAWGANDSGQTSPLPSGLTNVVAVAGGAAHSLALKGDGTVIAWGMNLNGQTTVPAGLNNAIRIGAGAAYSMALKSDGTVTNWGALATPAGLNGVTAIAAGWLHALALRTNGAIVAWGAQTNVPAGLGNAVAIAAGNSFSVAVRSDTTVIAWGTNAYGQTNVPPGLTDVKAIAAGGDHCLALRRDGTVVAWGRNDYGQATVPTNLGPVIAISAGALHSIVLQSDGTLYAWGNNTYSQTNTSTTLNGFIGVAAGQFHNLAIQGDNYPFILLQPLSQNVTITKNVTLLVTAAGATPLTYQWQHTCIGCPLSTLTNLPGGTNLPVATNASLVLTNFQITDGGQYVAVVANAYGSVTSQPALLVPVGGPPVVSVPLTNTAIGCGDPLTLAVSVDGTGPFGYQWHFAGMDLAGATDSSISFDNMTLSQSGLYSVTVTNQYFNGSNFVSGLVTTGAMVSVTVQAPTITSPPNATAQQGQPFSYTITALHSPMAYNASYLPAGLTVDQNTGLISGTPLESGTFGVQLSAVNACSNSVQTLVLTVASSAPVISGYLNPVGTEGQPFSYQIRANNNPTSFSAQNLPAGLVLDPTTGLIGGNPVLAGTYYATIYASNQWGFASATLRITIANAQISGLQIDRSGFSCTYHSPYLLDFTFTLRDTNGNPIVTTPNRLSATCDEGWPVNGGGPMFLSTNYNVLPGGTNWQDNYLTVGTFLAHGSGKVVKTILVLDYSWGVADPYYTGDSNGDGISDAVDMMVAGAQYYVDQQPGSTQIGVIEFHNDLEDPHLVTGLTKNHAAVDSAIAGIFTNYVTALGYGNSRLYDALVAATNALGSYSPDEVHNIIVISDGEDQSSLTSLGGATSAARSAGAQVYTLPIGYNPDLGTLGYIAAATGGRAYSGQTQDDIYQNFSLVTKELQAQYILRWQSSRRDPTLIFGPSFTINYQGYSASTPNWFYLYQTNYYTNAVMDQSGTITTNYITNNVVLWTNSIMRPFNINNVIPAQTNGGWTGPKPLGGPYSGPTTNGLLRLAVDDEVHPSGLTLRATYIPQYIRQIEIGYKANWPCTVSLESTNTWEFLYGWSLSTSSNANGITTVLLSSPNPANAGTSLPWPGFGPLITFSFQDQLFNPSNAFSFIAVSNAIYQGVTPGGRTWMFESNNNLTFSTNYPVLPHGTPVPWILQYNLTNVYSTNAWIGAELLDNDKDGMPNWKEYRAGTDPTKKSSVFKILPFTAANRLPNGQSLVSILTGTNRTYQLQSSTDLINWQTVQDDIPGNNTNVDIIDTRFYPGVNTLYYRAFVY